MEGGKSNNNSGCFKLLLYGCVALLVIVVLGGALEGIGNAFSGLGLLAIPLSIGFIYLLYKLAN